MAIKRLDVSSEVSQFLFTVEIEGCSDGIIMEVGIVGIWPCSYKRIHSAFAQR